MSMDTFFEQIIYSAANEDPNSERRALSLTNKDKVLCISGSGARPLDLLIDSPHEIVSIDFNARQNYLLELKMAAIATFDHHDCLEFLGIYEGNQREKQLKALEHQLSDEAKAYWRKENEIVKNGVIYCGIWESYMRKVKRMMKPRHALLHKLTASSSLEEQRKLWKKWRTWYWIAGMKPMDWRWVWRTILKEPGIEFIDPKYSIAGHLINSFDRAGNEQLLKHNPYYNLMVGDGYTDDAMPLHLQEKNFLTIRDNLPRIRVLSASLLDHMLENQNTYTAFSLSDFSSYSGPDLYKQVWEAVINSAKDGAKVCERFFMVFYNPEELFPGIIVRNPELEEKLHQDDHTFLYTFNCCTLNKNTGET